MKKTLIALAVLAASGASFAQVTLSGNLTMGFRSTTTGAATGSAEASGLGVDTSQINFTAVEDLGGGMRAVAKMSLAGADRSGESAAGAVAGRDATLTLITGAGMFQLGAVKAGDYVSGNGGKSGIDAYYGAGGDAFAGKVFSALTSRDTLTYILPMGAWTLAAGYQESANLLGLGAGTSGAPATTGQGFTVVSATYASGALAANGTYMAFRSGAAATAVGTGVKSVTRLSGSYDLGVVKLGLGAAVTDTDNMIAPATATGKSTDLGLSLTAPLGALTLGAQLVQRKIDDSAFTGQGVGTINGSALQGTYALSKRTSVIGNYARWTAAVGNEASSQYNLLLSHSF